MKLEEWLNAQIKICDTQIAYEGHDDVKSKWYARKRAFEITLAQLKSPTSSPSDIPGREIYNSHYYQGDFTNDVHTANLHFKNRDDYNRFLNWWVFGRESPDEIE